MIRKLTENYVEMRGWNIEDFLHFIMKTETEDNHMELPVPTHLQGFLIPAGDKNSEYEVTGNIQCTCGSGRFEVWESNKRHIVRLVCDQCRKEILLFDAGKHGWNGFVCKEDEYIDRSMPLKKYGCPECSKDVFNITVYISSQGKEDFIEECVSYDDSFSEEDWIDGFECISISLFCQECGFAEDEWVVLETM